MIIEFVAAVAIFMFGLLLILGWLAGDGDATPGILTAVIATFLFTAGVILGRLTV